MKVESCKGTAESPCLITAIAMCGCMHFDSPGPISRASSKRKEGAESRVSISYYVLPRTTPWNSCGVLGGSEGDKIVMESRKKMWRKNKIMKARKDDARSRFASAWSWGHDSNTHRSLFLNTCENISYHIIHPLILKVGAQTVGSSYFE